MDPKSIFLLGLLLLRVGRLARNERTTWSEGLEKRKLKSPHNTSLFVTLQSTNPEMTKYCEMSWCRKVDEMFVIKSNYVDWQEPDEKWMIRHFSKMILHTSRMSRSSEWYLFAFDDNYIFVDRLVRELSHLDPFLPIYSILKDPKSEFPHKPVLLLSRTALNTFIELQDDNCDENSEDVENWLTGCLTIPPINLSMDKEGKSRIFAIHRHFQVDEMKSMPVDYHDDKKFILSHSGSLLAFTNLTVVDLKLLPIFVEKIVGKIDNNKNRRIDNKKLEN